MLRFVAAWAAMLPWVLPAVSLPFRDNQVEQKQRMLGQQPINADMHSGKESLPTASKGSILEDFGRLAWEPAEAVDQGAKLLGAQAQIMGKTLSEAASRTAVKLKAGDFQGVLEVAADAVAEAEERSHSVKASFGRAARTSAGILLVIISVACLWGLEHLLSTRFEQHAASAELEGRNEDQPVHLPALDCLRYLMSWMAVLYNFYPWTIDSVAGRSADPLATFASWGILAAPMFFALSGFCHTYAKITGPKAELEEDMLSAMAVRVMVWYPYYVLVLIFLATNYLSYSAEDWTNFMAQLFLVGGVFFEHNLAAFPYMPSSWWFSFLMVYLLAWSPMHHAMSSGSNSIVWVVFIMATIAVFPSVLLEWWWFEDFAPFLLIQYCPAFFFGQALAAWHVNNCMLRKLPTPSATKPIYIMQPVEEMTFTVRFGMTVSVIILGMAMLLTSIYDKVFIFREYCISFYTKGLLLPVFGMMIASLACEADPLAKLMARKPVCWAGHLSLSQFMLALPVHIAVEKLTGFNGFTLTFVVCLTLASVAGYFCIEKPSRKLAKFLFQKMAKWQQRKS